MARTSRALSFHARHFQAKGGIAQYRQVWQQGKGLEHHGQILATQGDERLLPIAAT